MKFTIKNMQNENNILGDRLRDMKYVNMNDLSNKI